MSQSRVRKPPSNGGEPGSKGRAFNGKASGDTSLCTAPKSSKQNPLKQNPSKQTPLRQNEPKQNTNKPSPPHQNGDQNHNRIKNIPKSIRYDLENALVGLCDVWFEDIKPHLVRNKIKLHVESSAATASGDCARPPPAAAGCCHLDPGAGSDRPQRAGASFAACCSTQPSASRAQCRRPPAQHLPPSRPPPPSSRRPPVWIPQNKNSKSKSPRQTRFCRKSPQVHRSPASNWREPHPSWISSQLLLRQPVTQRRRIQTANPTLRTGEESCLLALVPRRRTNTRNKHTQTEINYKAFLHQQQSTSKMIKTEHIPQSAPGPRRKSVMNQENPKSDFHENLVHRLHRTEKMSSPEAYLNPLRDPCRMQFQKPDTAPKIRKPRGRIDIDLVQSKTIRYSLKTRDPQEHISRSRHRSHEKRPTMESNPQISQTRDKKSRMDSTIATTPRDLQPRVKQTDGSRFSRCFATTNLNQKNENKSCKYLKQAAAEPAVLFDKKLIDIIGERNDKRIRVLYKSPVRDEFPSVMNLVASPFIPTSEKHRPWR